VAEEAHQVATERLEGMEGDQKDRMGLGVVTNQDRITFGTLQVKVALNILVVIIRVLLV